MTHRNDRSTDFIREASGSSRPGLMSEFRAFLSQNKKWWLAPILAVFVLIGLIAIVGGQAAAPFVYTLF